MPTLTELLKAAGVELPATVNLSTMLEQSDEVIGLVAAKTELQTWKTDNKPLLDQLQLESKTNQEATAAAIEEKKALALQNNDLQAYLNAEKEGREKAEGLLVTSREGVRSAKHEAATSELAGWFSDPLVGKSFAGGLTSTTLNESGDSKTVYKLGQDEFSELDAFKAALSKDAGYGVHMKGPESKGPQFSGTGANEGQNKKSNVEIMYGTQE